MKLINKQFIKPILQLVKIRPKSKGDKDKKTNTYESLNALYGDREVTLKSGIFSLKSTNGKARPLEIAAQHKILTPKQCFEDYQ